MKMKKKDAVRAASNARPATRSTRRARPAVRNGEKKPPPGVSKSVVDLYEMEESGEGGDSEDARRELFR